MNCHQISLDASVGEFNSFINLWKQNGGLVDQLPEFQQKKDALFCAIVDALK